MSIPNYFSAQIIEVMGDWPGKKVSDSDFEYSNLPSCAATYLI